MIRYAGIRSGELSSRPRDILTHYSRIAMVGVSGNPTRASTATLLHRDGKRWSWDGR